MSYVIVFLIYCVVLCYIIVCPAGALANVCYVSAFANVLVNMVSYGEYAGFVNWSCRDLRLLCGVMLYLIVVLVC